LLAVFEAGDEWVGEDRSEEGNHPKNENFGGEHSCDDD
jgi:hypothetical protein